MATDSAIHFEMNGTYMAEQPRKQGRLPQSMDISSLSLGSTHTRRNHARQLLRAHAKEHSNSTAHHNNDQDSDASNQEEGRADILLLTSRTTPLNLLSGSVLIFNHSRLASTSVTVVSVTGAVFEVARPVPGAVVGCLGARRVGDVAYGCEVCVKAQRIPWQRPS